jgi:hypothetical protein
MVFAKVRENAKTKVFVSTLFESICQFQDTSYDATTFQFAASDAVHSAKAPKCQLSGQSSYCTINTVLCMFVILIQWEVRGNFEKI